MPYIGKTPTQGVRQRYMYTATAGQTTFSGTDTQNLTLSYSDSNFIDVYQNGVLLKTGTDYTATSGTSVVLTTGASVDDVVEMIVYDVFASADFYNRTDSDSRYVNIDGDTMTGNLKLKSTASTYEGLELITPSGDGSGEFHIGVHQDGSTSGRALHFRRGGSDGMDTLSAAIDASGNIGVGTSTIPAANSAYLTVGTQNYAISHNGFSKNSYFDGSSYKAITSDAGKLIQMGDDIIFYHSPSVSAGTAQTQSTLLTLHGGGNVTIADGDLVIGTSGHGIDFSATSNSSGSMSSELLDDYEEGTFTPSLASEGSSAISVGYGGTPGSQYTVGSYTKVGNTIHFQIVIDVDSYSGGQSSGNTLVIDGLPFTSFSYITGANGGGAVIYNAGHNTNPYTGIILGSQTRMRLYRDGAVTASQTGDFSASSYVQIAGSYKTDS